MLYTWICQLYLKLDPKTYPPMQLWEFSVKVNILK